MFTRGIKLRQLVGQQFQQFKGSSEKFRYLNQFMLNQISTAATSDVPGLQRHTSLNKMRSIKHRTLGNHVQ